MTKIKIHSFTLASENPNHEITIKIEEHKKSYRVNELIFKNTEEKFESFDLVGLGYELLRTLENSKTQFEIREELYRMQKI